MPEQSTFLIVTWIRGSIQYMLKIKPIYNDINNWLRMIVCMV